MMKIKGANGEYEAEWWLTNKGSVEITYYKLIPRRWRKTPKRKRYYETSMTQEWFSEKHVRDSLLIREHWMKKIGLEG